MVCAWDDQDDVEPGMVDEPRRAYRVGGAGAGDLHGDPRLPARRLSLRRQAQARVRGRLMNVAPIASKRARDWLDWPFFDASHRAFAEDLDRFVSSGAIAAIDHGD